MTMLMKSARKGRRKLGAVVWFGALAIWASLAGAAREGHAARRIFVWFADGGLPPRATPKSCGTPPPFRCNQGPTVDDCRRPIQALLDRWYADFDVVFTYTPPAVDAGPVDTVIVASEGAWCGADARTASRSPLPTCADMGSGVVMIFHCGDDAKKCATLIAKEQGHLVGLQHTGSPTDVMNELAGIEHDGFEDRENLSAAPRCGSRQNSYQLMRTRLGAWPAGMPKPDPGVPPPPNLPGLGDAGADGAATEDAAWVDDGASPVSPDGDSGANVEGGNVGAANADGEGCSCDIGATPTRPQPGWALLGLLTLAWTRRWARLRCRGQVSNRITGQSTAKPALTP